MQQGLRSERFRPKLCRMKQWLTGGMLALFAVAAHAQGPATVPPPGAAAQAITPAAASPDTPTLPPASIDNSLEILGDAIDAEQIRNRLLIDVKVNGKGPFHFLVDSGADRTVIGFGLAARLNLPAGPAVKLQSMAGATQVGTVLIDRLTIGTSEIVGITAPALSERDLGAQGLVGIDALADQRLLLDFDAHTITVQDSRKPDTLESGEIVVTARRRRGQLILTQASLGGSHLYAVIDTGAELTIGNSALLTEIFHGHQPPALQPITLISVTGQTISAKAATLPAIRIGGIVLQNVVVAFVDAPPFALFGLSRQPALLLGTDLLKSFKKVGLDFRNRKVRFVLRR